MDLEKWVVGQWYCGCENELEEDTIFGPFDSKQDADEWIEANRVIDTSELNDPGDDRSYMSDGVRIGGYEAFKIIIEPSRSKMERERL